MRIAVIQNIEQWTGAIAEQFFLQLPEDCDISKEEEVWFVSGGGTPIEFVDHLISKGARKIEVEIWPIRYH